MIKKIIAFLTICFIITGIISPVFSDASALPQPNWTDPGISEIINISDLTGWMLNGGTFDVSQYTDAESFMNDYFNARTRTRLVSPGEAAEDYYEVLPGFGINNQLVAGESFARPLDTNRVISSSFRDHTGYGRRLSNEVNEALLSSGSLYDTKIPLLNEVEFDNFVNYNHDALRLYSEFFDSEVPEPSPDPSYSYLNNTKDFIWYNTNINTIESGKFLKWYTIYLNPSDISFVATAERNDFETSTMIFSSLGNIYINDDNNNITVTYDNFKLYLKASDANAWAKNFSCYGTEGDYLHIDSFGGWQYNNQNITTRSFRTSFDSLSVCCNYIFDNFRHVNIFYNNQPWVLVDQISTPSITPEFPDAVGGEDLPNTTWPISRPRAPYYTSVPGMLQAIDDAIQGNGELDIDDLKPYLTDENGDPVPDPIFDPEPVPIPVPDPVNPDVVPGLPELPAMPLDMPGFNGVSVLAEIINFTNQSLPTSLIVTFWGIVFGIVILGLIKILHK